LSALRVALAGNPNTGKTSLFNALTGSRAKVGNYPGITVESREGGMTTPAGTAITLVDIPGCYSLTARSMEEEVAHDILIGALGGAGADVIVVVADAANLARNLYLVLQLAELGRPTLLALNMMDVAEAAGVSIDIAGLEKSLGMPVAPIVAPEGRGVPELIGRLDELLANPVTSTLSPALSEADQAPVTALRALLEERGVEASEGQALWLLTSNERHTARYPDLQEKILETRRTLAIPGDPGRPADFARRVIMARYDRIDAVFATCVTVTAPPGESRTERLDRVLTHRVWGMGLFVLAMMVLFQAVFTWAEPLIGGIEEAMAWFAGVVGSALPAGVLREMIVDGLIAGVGNILVFLPQILLLFLGVALMEESGYMARVALLLDSVMRRVGLHGKAFVPLLSSFACAIPGIMAARTIETTRDRLVTIMVAPLMSCSARLPVYTLVIAAVFPSNDTVFGVLSLGGLIVTAMYFLGIAAALGMAYIFKRTLLKAPTPALILELPEYQRPQLRTVLLTMYRRGKVFVTQTGTVILALSVILWAAMSYPRPSFSPEQAAELDDRAQAQIRLRDSVAGTVGRAIEPIIEPLGFDWKIGIGLVGSFAAREVLVSTLGQVYGVGSDVDEESVVLRHALLADKDPQTGKSRFTPLVGLSLMVFFVLAMQCLSTIAVVRRETASWRWPIIMIVYMNVLAWTASLLTYQIGSGLGFS